MNKIVVLVMVMMVFYYYYFFLFLPSELKTKVILAIVKYNPEGVEKFSRKGTG